MDLAERLRLELSLWGVRPAEVARRAGVDQGHLSRVLSGAVRPTPETVRRILEAAHRDALATPTTTTTPLGAGASVPGTSERRRPA